MYGFKFKEKEKKKDDSNEVKLTEKCEEEKERKLRR